MPPGLEPLRPLLPYCIAWLLFMLLVSVLLGPVRRGLRRPARRGLRTLGLGLLMFSLAAGLLLVGLSALWTLAEFGVGEGLRRALDGLTLPSVSWAPFGREIEFPLLLVVLPILLFLLWALWRLLRGGGPRRPWRRTPS